MRKIRTKHDKGTEVIARAFMTHNNENKSILQKQRDFELGYKVEHGIISEVSDVIRAVSILSELAYQNRITKEKSIELKMNLAQKMSGFKIVPKKESSNIIPTTVG